MKYLFELVYKDSTATKKKTYYTPQKRALFCPKCNEVYKISLEDELIKINHDTKKLKEKISESLKV